MRDYKTVDVNTLTIDDALQDSDFRKKPLDYFQYIILDKDILNNLLECSDSEIAEIVNNIAIYCLDGDEPNYQTLSTSGVRMNVRTMIRDHKARMNSEYLRHYKQFVRKRQNEQHANTS